MRDAKTKIDLLRADRDTYESLKGFVNVQTSTCRWKLSMKMKSLVKIIKGQFAVVILDTGCKCSFLFKYNFVKKKKISFLWEIRVVECVQPSQNQLSLQLTSREYRNEVKRDV